MQRQLPLLFIAVAQIEVKTSQYASAGIVDIMWNQNYCNSDHVFSHVSHIDLNYGTRYQLLCLIPILAWQRTKLEYKIMHVISWHYTEASHQHNQDVLTSLFGCTHVHV